MDSGYDKREGTATSAEWEYLQSKRSSHFRGTLTKRFNKFFPNGHKTSIRPLVEEIAKHVLSGEIFSDSAIFQHMNDIHPEAFEVITKYGKDYTPLIWDRALPEPDDGCCFGNAWQLADSIRKKPGQERDAHEPSVYVEGIAFGSVVRPMLHAWNAHSLNGEIAIDWTHYTVCRWSRYLGIPITLEEHAELRHLTPLGKNVNLLFHKKYFTPQAKIRLVSILEERKTT
ncbi:MAG TPA: hypothetical protein VMV71_03070 [Candidatus Paceibacterota bacterium]|nr:hypothetical protein [Candidatus Paceibacterota bacterium]